MERKTKRVIIGIVTIIIIALMIIYVDFRTILTNLQKVSFLGIFLFCLIYTFAFIFRAYKLDLVFRGIKKNPKYSSLYGAIGTAWALNELTPAKLGDLAKMEYIHQVEKDISFGKAVCGVLIDRFIDLIILFLITFGTLIYIFFNNIGFLNELNIQFFLIIGALIILVAVVGLIFLFFRTDWILNIIGKISNKLKNLLERFINRFIEGIIDFRKDRKRIFWTFIFNIPTWLCESLTLVILFYFTGFNFNILVIILAQLITIFTKTIPITPGGWGVSEVTGAILIHLFYPSVLLEEILSIFILDHVIRIVYVFIYGGISTVAINFKFHLRKLNEIEEKEDQIKQSNSS
jgi:hypothetical protein